MRFCFDSKTFVEKDVQPDKLAVIGSDVELTWNEFAQQVDALCDRLTQSKLTEQEYPVIIYGHKSAQMLVAMYALMQLEMAYIPVDVIYPIERVAKIAEIAHCQFVINTSDTPLNLPNTTEWSVTRKGISELSSVAVLQRTTRPDDPLVYIIFTSGSTGEPKGVQISTEAVRSFTRWMTSDFGFTADDVFINSAVLSFDLSVFEVMTFGALGATLLLNDKTTSSDPALMLPRVEKYRGSVWVSTPSFAMLYARMKDERRLDSVRVFLFCGEVLPNDLAQKLLDHYPQARVINTYGPTEATVATTLIEITQAIIDAHNPLPVGASKRESQLLIDNGEIVIVGPNVSKGYLYNDALNAQKFTIIDGQRAFRTGDNGFLQDDVLFFSGRDDDLIKLHGYRIELNEINAAINDLDYVHQGEAIALKRNGSVKKIVAVVQLNNETEAVDAASIKDAIAHRLPHYMIPSDIKFIAEIPLNQNGKADKKRLAELYVSL